jgi:hypothetical protein
MDSTITHNEVTMLVGTNLLALDLCPNFERIHICCHFERVLQCLPCPQTSLHGWKGMVIALELYALLTLNAFHLPNNPGKTTVYVRTALASQPVDTLPLMQMEQATIDKRFTCMKHYFMSCAVLRGHASQPLMQASMTPSRYRRTLPSRDSMLDCA